MENEIVMQYIIQAHETATDKQINILCEDSILASAIINMIKNTQDVSLIIDKKYVYHGGKFIDVK